MNRNRTFIFQILMGLNLMKKTSSQGTIHDGVEHLKDRSKRKRLTNIFKKDFAKFCCCIPEGQWVVMN